jgi:hypothetical protein
MTPVTAPVSPDQNDDNGMEFENPLANPVTAKVAMVPDHLKKHYRCSAALAIVELIWNAFDADAQKVEVFLVRGLAGTVDSIEVHDNGDGIDITRARPAFENFGGSWKSITKVTPKGRSMNGRHGHGRFRACSLGRIVSWQTVNRAVTNDNYAFNVAINMDRPDDVAISKAELVSRTAKAGTRVTIGELYRPHGRTNIRPEPIRTALVEHFGHFLIENPATRLYFDGQQVDAKPLIDHEESKPFEVVGQDDDAESSTARIVHWKKPFRGRRVFLCGSDGTTINSVTMDAHVLSDKISVYVKSPLIEDAFAEIPSDQLNDLEEIKPLLAAVREEVKQYAERRRLERAEESVDRWKREGIYPFDDAPAQGDGLEAVKRMLFNQIAGTLEEHVASFATPSNVVRKLQFRLIRHALETNAESLVELFDGLAGLPKAEVDRLLALVRECSFTQILSTMTMISSRLKILEGMSMLLNDPKIRKATKERKHLHEVLAQNLWILGEDFGAITSDEALTTSVERHVALLKIPAVVDAIDKAAGRKRMDLFLTGVTKAVAGSQRHERLVVELKRPSEKGGLAIVSQMKEYALLLSEEAEWKNTTNWTFWGIVFDLDAHGQREVASGSGKPEGLVARYDHATLWLRTWADVLDAAERRLKFIRDKIKSNTPQVESLAHLVRTHRKHVPEAAVAAVRKGRAKRAQQNRTQTGVGPSRRTAHSRVKA